MKTKPIKNERVNFPLSECSTEALNFTIRSSPLKSRHYHVFKATGLFLLRYDSTGFWIVIPTSTKTGGHGLIHRIGVSLAGINPKYSFAYVWKLSKKTFTNNCFAWKNDKWTTNDVFSNFFQQVFISLCGRIDYCFGWFVQTNGNQVW